MHSAEDCSDLLSWWLPLQTWITWRGGYLFCRHCSSSSDAPANTQIYLASHLSNSAVHSNCSFTGISWFVSPHIWGAFASPTSTWRPRLLSEDPSSCSGPMKNGPSSACPTSPYSASTRSPPSRWPKATQLCHSAGCASTLLTSMVFIQHGNRIHHHHARELVTSTGALATLWNRWCTF